MSYQIRERGPQDRITPREREILDLVARGCRNREIAALLSITAGTVKAHLKHIFVKTGVKTRADLSAQAGKLVVPGDTT